MGADLYRESITEPASAKYRADWLHAIQDHTPSDEQCEKAHQEECDRLWELMYPEEGYFRDSYNSSNLLWTLGLSWWQLPIDDDGYMGGDKLKEFHDQVVNATQTIPEKVPDAEKAEAIQYFQEKRKKLITFLDGAINAGERVRFSV